MYCYADICRLVASAVGRDLVSEGTNATSMLSARRYRSSDREQGSASNWRSDCSVHKVVSGAQLMTEYVLISRTRGRLRSESRLLGLA
jgi:hypothetical protein